MLVGYDKLLPHEQWIYIYEVKCVVSKQASVGGYVTQQTV